eukprot:251176-Rhodomonas_salina.4
MRGGRSWRAAPRPAATRSIRCTPGPRELILQSELPNVRITQHVRGLEGGLGGGLPEHAPCNGLETVGPDPSPPVRPFVVEIGKPYTVASPVVMPNGVGFVRTGHGISNRGDASTSADQYARDAVREEILTVAPYARSVPPLRVPSPPSDLPATG